MADLRGSPPAFIGVGTLDPFADEDIAYAQRLNPSAVMTELIVVPGVFHGFDSRFPMRVGAWPPQATIAALRRGFGTA